MTFQLKDEEGQVIFVAGSGVYDEKIIKEGRQIVSCHIPANFFNSGIFYINLLLIENMRTTLFRENDIIKFVLIDAQVSDGRWMSRTSGPLKPHFKWSSTSAANLKK